MPPLDETVPNKWGELQDTISQTEYSSALGLALSLAIGGVLAMYIRFLYRRTSPHAAADSIARVFPLLTLVTIAVIAVVKGSLALSLGLVGALSIVRFRAAIKDPEELVYLFLCIGVGLALGAEQPYLAVTLVIVASVFILVFDKFRIGARAADTGYVTIVGSAERYFGEEATSALAVVREVCPRLTVQRCEVDGDEGQLRVRVLGTGDADAQQLIASLRARLPECQISYLNETML